jgi:hypothetical protein
MPRDVRVLGIGKNKSIKSFWIRGVPRVKKLKSMERCTSFPPDINNLCSLGHEWCREARKTRQGLQLNWVGRLGFRASMKDVPGKCYVFGDICRKDRNR